MKILAKGFRNYLSCCFLLCMPGWLHAQAPGIELPKVAEKVEWEKIGEVGNAIVSYDINSRLEHDNLVFSRFRLFYASPKTIALAAMTYDEEWLSYQLDCANALIATTGAAKLNKGNVIQDFDIRKMSGMVIMPKMRPLIFSGVEGLAFMKVCQASAK